MVTGWMEIVRSSWSGSGGIRYEYEKRGRVWLAPAAATTAGLASNAPFSASVRVRSAGSRTSTAMRPSGSYPSGVVWMWWSWRATMAVIAKSPTAAANWTPTSPRRSHVVPRPSPVDPPPLPSARAGLYRESARAGYSPATRPIATTAAAAVSQNGTSSEPSVSAFPNVSLKAGSARAASATPTAPAATARTTDSVRNWATSPLRSAPSAFRTPTSAVRRDPRAVARLT